MPPYKGFIGPSNSSLSPIADQELTMNMYIELSESVGAASPLVLYSIPGFETIGTVPNPGVGRGHIFIGGREFFVVGDTLYEMSNLGVITVLGTVDEDSNPVTWASNGDAGNQLLLTSGGNAYVLDTETNVLTEVANLHGLAFMCCGINNYALVLDRATSTIYVSDLADFATFDLGNFIQRSQAPDPWVAIGVSGKYLYFIGSQTGECWFNQFSEGSDVGVPFTPTSAGVFNFGIIAPFSFKVVGDSAFWLGATVSGSGLVCKAPGLRPEVVSTNAMQVQLQGLNTLSDAIGDSHEILDHQFYTITFKSENITIAFDDAGEAANWTDRGFWNVTTGQYDAWRPLFHAFAFEQARFLDRSSGAVYRMSTNLATDIDGRGIRWLRRAPSIMNENKMLFWGDFEVICETGIGLTTGQGSDPQIMMRFSNDGGRTWSPEAWRTMGKKGEYGQRVRWTRGGRGRKRAYEVSGHDPVRVMIAGATIEPLQSTE